MNKKQSDARSQLEDLRKHRLLDNPTNRAERKRYEKLMRDAGFSEYIPEQKKVWDENKKEPFIKK